MSRWVHLALIAWSVAFGSSSALAQPLPPPKPSATAVASAPAPKVTPSAAPPATSSTGPMASSSPTASVSAAPSAAIVVEPPPPVPQPPPPPPPTATASATAAVSVEPPLPPAPTASAPPPAPSATPAPESTAPAEVRLHDGVAFLIRVSHGGQSADKRAKDATKALKDAFDNASPEDVRVEILSEKDGKVTEPTAVIYVGKTPIVQLTAADATAAGDATLAVHADSVAAQLRKAMSAERARSTLASTVFSVSLVVFLGLVMLYLLRKVGEFTERANAWVEANPDRIPAVRVSRMEVLNPGTLRSGLALTISVGKWVGWFGIVYAWLIAALSLFESTRSYTEKLTGFIIEPFASLASRVASTLPILLVIAIALLAVAILLRVVGLFFEGVATDTTTLNWLPPDLAKPTSLVVRAGIVLSTLVFAAPLITGNQEGALPRTGLVTMVALGLASVPFLASCILGAVAVFGRRVRVGEYIDLDGRVGRVVDLSLLNISLEDESGVETRVPHFAWLLRPMRMLGSAPRISVALSVPRGGSALEIRARLLEAIGDVGSDPRVEIDRVDEKAIYFALSVVSEDIDVRSRIFASALAASERPRPHDNPSDAEAGTDVA